MVKIFTYSEENRYMTFEITDISDIELLSKLLDRIFENVFIDWIFLFEELHDKIEDGITNKRIKIVERGLNNRYIIVSVHNEDIVAIMQS